MSPARTVSKVACLAGLALALAEACAAARAQEGTVPAASPVTSASPASPPAPAAPVMGSTLPVDIDDLLQITRIREGLSARLLYKYTFRQSTTEEWLDDDGNVKRRHATSYRVIPTHGGTERHLISEDGETASPSAVRKQEKRNDRLAEHWAKLAAKEQAAAEARAREQQARAAAAAAAAPVVARPAPIRAAPPPLPSPSDEAKSAAPVQSPGTAPAEAPFVRPSTPPSSAPAPARALPTSPTQGIIAAPVTTLPGDRVLPSREAPLPGCDMANLASSLLPPPAGSVLRSRRPASAGDEASRRARDKTSDYSLFELLSLTEYEYAGQCAWNGRAMHVLTFAPPEGFDAQNPVERVMTAMKGTIVIDAGDMQVARAEGTTVAPIAWGAGMVKLKQAHVMLEYGRVHDEIWLPSRDVFEFDSRVLFASERQRITHAFDDFSRADVQVETEVEYRDPDAPAAAAPPSALPAPGK